MKWIAGIGKRLGGILSAGDGGEAKALERYRHQLISRGLTRLFPDNAADPSLVDVIQDRQRQIDAIHEQTQSQQAPQTVNFDGLSQLKTFKENQQGYLVVYVQGYLTGVLQHLIRTAQGRSESIANVVFQPHEDPSAHVSVLERGHGLAFELPFFPVENDEAMLCPFLGELTAVSLKVAAFAAATQAPVLPLWGRLDEGSHGLTLEIGEPIVSHRSAETLTFALLERFGRWIRTNPADMDWESPCLDPPARRILPSRFHWKLELGESAKSPPLRSFHLLVRTPDQLREACLAVPAIRALKRGRPDVHLTILCETEMVPFWNLLKECDACLDLHTEPNADGFTFDVGILLNMERDSLAQLERLGVHRTMAMENHPSAGDVDDALNMPRKLGPPEHRHRTFLRIAHRLGADVLHDPSLRDPMQPAAQPAQPEAETKTASPSPEPTKKVGKKRSGKRRSGKAIASKGDASTANAGTPPAQATPTPKPPPGRVTIALSPGAEDGTAFAWDRERFAEVVRITVKDRGYAWRLFARDESEREAWGTLAAEWPDDDVSLVDHSASLNERLDALSACRLVLANDNDDLHLAATVRGTPTVAIFGPRDPIQTAPVGPNALVLRRHVECTPCFLADCPIDHRCLNEIPVAEVLEAITVSLAQSDKGLG